MNIYGDSSFKVNKTKIFKLDRKQSNIDTEYTSRHTYASYNEDIGISGKNKANLCYDLGLEKQGTIALRFKCDELRSFNFIPSRTILASGLSNINKLVVSISRLNLEICVSFNGTRYQTGLYVIPDTWHQFIIEWNPNSLKITLDNVCKTYNDSNITYPDLTNCKTYIGTNNINNEAGVGLIGSIEMLAYSKNNISNIKSLLNNNKPISVLKEYDESDRIIEKEINTGLQKLKHKYIYNDQNQKIHPLPVMEVLPDETQVIYTYDRSGNIVHKVTISNEAIKESINYKYDISGRLIKEKCYTNNSFEYSKEYIYNNIGDILEKREYNGNIETKSIYTYSESIKGQLLNIKTYDSNNTLINTLPLTYLDSDPFKPNSYKGQSIIWEGKRLKTLGNNRYIYNSEGIRIRKETEEGIYKYILDGNKIIKEIKPNNKEVYYHYDETNQLVGFHYQEEYFYVRDITGNIISIIDINGIEKVKYRYDSYGNIISKTGDNELISINSFVYKGYYYDEETGLFYCNSRYYSPELCRFISPDDVEYLDPESINGLNLYVYCMNNPIMYVDPDGHMPLLVIALITGVIAAGANVFSQRYLKRKHLMKLFGLM